MAWHKVKEKGNKRQEKKKSLRMMMPCYGTVLLKKENRNLGKHTIPNRQNEKGKLLMS